MKEIRIFLGSSYELEPDRVRFGDMIRRLNEEYEPLNFHLSLIKWEDLPGFYTEGGQQSNYDSCIKASHIFVALFWHRAGKHTIKEYEVANGAIADNNLRLETSYIFLRDKDSELSSIERSLVRRYWDEHSPEEIKEDEEQLARFIKENTPTANYRDFNELEKQFRVLLDCWIKGHQNLNFPEWEISGQNRVIITFSEDALNFDFACIGDLLRNLNQHNWNSQHYCVQASISPNSCNSQFMLCLNCKQFPEHEQELVSNFLDLNRGNDASPLLLMQRKGDGKSSTELEQWYRDKSQYSASYTSVDSLLLKFIQHLLLHWHWNEPFSRNGMLYLKDDKVNFAILDMSGCKAVKELYAKLREAEVKVKQLKQIFDEDPLKNGIVKELEDAQKARDVCAAEMDKKIDEYLKLDRQLIKNKSRFLAEQYEELATLCENGDFAECNKKIKALLPSDVECEELKNSIVNSRRQIAELNEENYTLDREMQENTNLIKKNENNLEEDTLKAKNDIEMFILAAASSQATNEPLENAIAYFEKADSLCGVVDPDNENRVWYIVKPLGELYKKFHRLIDAINAYKRCIEQLQKYENKDLDVSIANLYYDIARCYFDISNYSESIAYAKKAIEFAPSIYELGANLLICDNYYVLNNYTEAQKYLQKACKVAFGEMQRNWCEIWRAAIFTQQKNYALAEKSCHLVGLYFSNIWEDKELQSKFNLSALSQVNEDVSEKWLIFSRCIVLYFDILDDEQKELMSHLFQNIAEILTAEPRYENAFLEISKNLSMLKDKKWLCHYYRDAGVRLIGVNETAALVINLTAALEELALAKDCLKQLPQDYSLAAHIYLESAYVLERLEKYNEALDELALAKDCLKQLPQDYSLAAHIYDNCAHVLNELDKHVSALEHLDYAQKCLQQRPNADLSAWISIDRGIAYIGLEDYNTALKEFALAKDCLQDSPQYYNLSVWINIETGIALERLGKYDEALLHLNMARGNIHNCPTPSIHLSTHFDLALSEMGEHFEELGQLDEMRQCYEMILDVYSEVDKNDMSSWVSVKKWQGIGAAHRKLGNLQDAMAAYNKVMQILEAAGEHSLTLGTTYNTIGHLQFELGNLDDALEYSKKGLAIMQKEDVNANEGFIPRIQVFIKDIQEKIHEKNTSNK